MFFNFDFISIWMRKIFKSFFDAFMLVIHLRLHCDIFLTLRSLVTENLSMTWNLNFYSLLDVCTLIVTLIKHVYIPFKHVCLIICLEIQVSSIIPLLRFAHRPKTYLNCPFYIIVDDVLMIIASENIANLFAI